MQPGGLDLGALMEQAQAMQQQVAEAQASLAGVRATGSAGGGLVRAETDGNGQLVGLEIDPSVVDPDDIETLADLVVAAVRDGAKAAEKLAQETMGSVAGGLMGGAGGPGLPGGLGGLSDSGDSSGSRGGLPDVPSGRLPRGGIPGLEGLLGAPGAPLPDSDDPGAGATGDSGAGATRDPGAGATRDPGR